MDWKIGKYRRYFGETSNIGQHHNDNQHRLSIDGKIGQKSAKSPIYRRNISGEPKNRPVEACAEKTEKDGKKSVINQ